MRSNVAKRWQAGRRAALGGAALGIAGIVLVAVVATSHLGGTPVNAAHADAVNTLHSTAQSALANPTATPNPQDFVYIEIKFSTGQTGRFWESVDGTRDGAMMRPDLGGMIPVPGCRNGKQSVVRGTTVLAMTEPCTPQPAVLPATSTTSAKIKTMLTESVSADGATGPEQTNIQSKTALNMLEFTYMTSSQRASLISAVEQLPGLTVTKDAVDGANRHGLGIQWATPDGKSRQTMVVNPTSGQYLGTPGGDSVMQMKIVATVGATS